MPKPREIVLAYQQAVGKKDFAAARRLMHDNLEFRGPIDTFHTADHYLHAIQNRSWTDDVVLKRDFSEFTLETFPETSSFVEVLSEAVDIAQVPRSVE